MRQKLETLRAAMDALNVGVVVIDETDHIVVFNRTAGSVLLQKEPEKRIGSSILRCHPERAEPGFMKMIAKMKSGEMKKYEGWVNFGGKILYEYIYPLWDQKGKYIGAVSELHPAAEKAEYLKSKGEWKEPQMHGLGESAPRSPYPEE